MARTGLAERPPVDPPRALRPLLKLTKVPPRGLAVVRRVVDEDGAFRDRVAAVAAGAQDELGRPSWLFLTRPPGWEGELDQLAAGAAEAAAVSADAAAEHRAERRLRHAQERVARLEAESAQARAREESREAELASLRQTAQETSALLDAERQVSRRLRQERDAALARASAAEAALADAADAAPTAPDAETPPPLPPPVDLDALRQALTDAVDAAERAATALASARGLVPDGPAGDAATPPEPASTGPRPTRARSERARPRATSARRAMPLPPGLLDDSVEAAEFLVRASGAVVLVDGYNASISAWPDLPLSEQRSRLVDALAELAARTGADAQVVFDGTQESGAPVPVRHVRVGARPPVRVLFSPADVAADDVILDLVDRVPQHRPVVVATDDRQVQEGARQRGANVLTRAQLLAALRRGPTSALG